MSSSVKRALFMQNFRFLNRFEGQLEQVAMPVFKALGIIIFIIGLQFYGFYQYFSPAVVVANQNLDRLMNEVTSNALAETVLRGLEDVRRHNEDEAFRRQINQMYDQFIEKFIADPRTTLQDFEGAIAGIPTQPTALGNDAVSMLKWDVSRLKEIYSDHYRDLHADLQSPPMYLQPVASVLKRTSGLEAKVAFNQALYLSLVGDRNTANTTFNELKQNLADQDFISAVYYAQARMLFAAFESEGRVEYYLQAIQNLQQSLRYNPTYGMAKLFLEYLLSLQGGGSAEAVPSEGDGSGEAQGEKGMISSQPLTF